MEKLLEFSCQIGVALNKELLVNVTLHIFLFPILYYLYTRVYPVQSVMRLFVIRMTLLLVLVKCHSISSIIL